MAEITIDILKVLTETQRVECMCKALREFAEKLEKECLKGDARYYGSTIRHHRKRAGMTQQQLAEKLGLKSSTTVAKWETGASTPRLDVMMKLTKIFGCTLDDLVDERR